jgi:epsilon-lactone hydrolase
LGEASESGDGRFLCETFALVISRLQFTAMRRTPIYGDFHGFPPTILTSGTRDLFLSNTVRTNRKLRRAGVIADLNVYEGMSHAQYRFDPDAPETKETFTGIANFFNRHLGK